MKTLSRILTLVFLSLALTAQAQYTYTENNGGWNSTKVKGSKHYVTKEYRPENFTHVSLTGSSNLTYTQRVGKPRVEVYTSDNLIDLLKVEVKNGILSIGFKKGYNVQYNKLEVRVWSETLNGIGAAGSGDIKLTAGLHTDKLKMSVAGSGSISTDGLTCTDDLDISVAGSGDVVLKNVECGDLKTSIAGSGDMKLTNVTTGSVKSSIAGSGTLELSGQTESAGYSISGSGDILAQNLVAKRVSASISGSGDIKCHAVDFLKVRTSGSGSVGYKGDPELDIPRKNLRKLD